MAAPEGKVKTMVKLLLKQYGAYYEMPVPGGFGKAGLDFIICYNGFFLSIETKAPGKKPTPRQLKTMADIHKAGGATLVIDGKESIEMLEAWLKLMSNKHPSQFFNQEEKKDGESGTKEQPGSAAKRIITIN